MLQTSFDWNIVVVFVSTLSNVVISCRKPLYLITVRMFIIDKTSQSHHGGRRTARIIYSFLLKLLALSVLAGSVMSLASDNLIWSYLVIGCFMLFKSS